jgi:hypothetical protein
MVFLLWNRILAKAGTILEEEWSSMNYEEARAYLDDAARYGSVLGLDTMKELLARLGNPQDDLKFIHIGQWQRIGTFLSFCRSERSRLSRWTIYFADAVFLPGTYTGK